MGRHPTKGWVGFWVACGAALTATSWIGATAQERRPAVPTVGIAPARPYHADRLIVRVAPGLVAPESSVSGLRGGAVGASEVDAPIDALRRQLGATRLSPLFPARPPAPASAGAHPSLPASSRETIFLVELEPGQDLVDALARARAHPDVTSAQLDFLYTPDLVPNDARFPEQFAHQITDAVSAWELETGDPAVAIAVLGTGIDRTHPDLGANMWENTVEIPDNGIDDDANGFIDDRHGWDFLDDDADPLPEDDPHETHVAGVAAAVGNNSIGVAGIAWNVRIMALRVEFSSSSVAQAIAYAQDNGARVINMSFGNYGIARYGPDSVVEAAVESAFAAGIVLVATAGNNSIKTARFPAALPDVIAVAATDENDQRAGFSNWGSFVSVAAPGVGILSTVLDAEFDTASGTSFAAPYVSGLAALLLSKEPSLTPTDVRRRIEYASDAIATDFFIGSGRVNALRALSLDADPELFAVIKSPLDREVLQGTKILGTALGDSYQLEVRPAEGADWIPLSNGIDAVDDVLGSLDGAALETGFYELRLTARLGAESASHEVSFFVADLLAGWPQGAAAEVHSAPSYADADRDGDLEIFVADVVGSVHAWHHDGVPLPDWPVFGQFNAFGSPALGDIDGDGEAEILQGSFSGGVYAWNLDGSVVEGWPQLVDAPVRGAVALADFDADGAYEVVAAGATGVVHVFSGDGSDLPGWPVTTESNVQSTPAVGDLDGDGALEVVVKQATKVYAWHSDGSLLAGWPVEVGGSQTAPVLLDRDGDGSDEVVVVGDGVRILDRDGTELAASLDAGASGGAIGAGDVDGDGRPEICFGVSGIALLDLDLNVLPGWPISITGLQHCLMGDVDGDGLQEVVGATQEGQIFAWDADGSIAPGNWPLYAGAPIHAAPALGDLDGDGALELMVGNAAGELHVFALGVASGPGSLAWPMLHGSERHDGRVVSVPEPSAAAQALSALLALCWLRRRNCQPLCGTPIA